jgi:hypothetical protein
MRLSKTACAVFLIAAAASAEARDDHLKMPVAEALAAPAAREKLDPRVGLYFGDRGHPDVARRIGSWKTNKKTNKFNKTEQQACEWAFLSAMLQLQERARREGGDAVVNIVSVYRNVEFSSATKYTCGVGAMVAGVAFRGEVVKLSK